MKWPGDDAGRLSDLERRGISIRATTKLDPSFLRRTLPAPRASMVAVVIESVDRRARRLLAVRPLRAADALQLAAALDRVVHAHGRAARRS